MRLGWKYLCERQDAKRATHGRGIKSMTPNGRSMDGGLTPETNDDHLYLEIQEVYQQIEILPPSQASRILGVRISPDGSSHEQTRPLRQTTTSWVDCVRLGHIRKCNTWLYFQTTVKKSIEYPLVATTTKSSQYHFVESPALCTVLQA